MDDEEARRTIERAAYAIDGGDTGEARRALATLLREATPARCREHATWLVFAAALTHRLEGRGEGEPNLYLRDYDVPQIHLFGLLANHVPSVAGAVTLANSLIAREMAGADEATLVDVGIGTGRQVVRLLEQLAAESRLPRRLRVIGVEPRKAALDLARAAITQVGHALEVNVEWRGIEGTAEDLSEAAWEVLAREVDAPIVNAAFALHHVRAEPGRDVRLDVLRRIASLSPSLFVLLEPSSDHYEPRFVPRFDACLDHFRTTFRLIDALAIAEHDKQALKVCFFGREIVDILAADEASRSERHEPAPIWRARLGMAGFAMVPPEEIVAGQRVSVISLAAHEGFVGLDHEEKTLVAVLAGVHAGPSSEELEMGDLDAPPTLIGVNPLLDRASVAPEGPPTVPAPPPFRAPATPELDAELYLATLMRVARAGGDEVTPRARAFIEEQARLLGTPTQGLWGLTTLAGVIANAGAVAARARHVILRDLVFIALLDGEYSEPKRAAIRAVATRIGLDASDVDLAEREIEDIVPDALAVTPEWFRECWFIAGKR